MMYSAYFATRPDCSTFVFNLQSNFQLHFFQIRGKYIFLYNFTGKILLSLSPIYHVQNATSDLSSQSCDRAVNGLIIRSFS